MTSHSKYPESLICHACHSAYLAMRQHYGSDENDKKDPRGVEMAIRRDVIAVLKGATAKELHNRWVDRKLQSMKDTAFSYSELKKQNPTLGLWSEIPEVDKEGYRLFCRVVHQARREHEAAGFSAIANAKFPETFKITDMTTGGFSKPHREFPSNTPKTKTFHVSGLGDVMIVYNPLKSQPEGHIRDNKQKRLHYCASVASNVLAAYSSVLGYGIGPFYSNLQLAEFVLKNPSAPSLFQELERKQGGNHHRSIAPRRWHEISKSAQAVYTIYVSAVVAAAEQFDLRCVNY